jgi:hypothetical protein
MFSEENNSGSLIVLSSRKPYRKLCLRQIVKNEVIGASRSNPTGTGGKHAAIPRAEAIAPKWFALQNLARDSLQRPSPDPKATLIVIMQIVTSRLFPIYARDADA